MVFMSALWCMSLLINVRDYCVEGNNVGLHLYYKKKKYKRKKNVRRERWKCEMNRQHLPYKVGIFIDIMNTVLLCM